MKLWSSLVAVLLLLVIVVVAGCGSKSQTQPVVNLTNDTGDSLGASITVDKDDNVHLSYYDSTSGKNEIYYMTKSRGGSWSAPVNVSKNNGESFSPNLVVGPDGTLNLAWHDDEYSRNYQVLFSSKSPGADWTKAVNVSAMEQDCFSPSMVRDSDGNLHVVWSSITTGNWEIFYSFTVDGGVNWSVPINVSNNEGASMNPTLTIDSEGTLQLAWEDDTSGDYDIRYSSKTKEGSWTESENVSLDPGKDANARLVVDSQGNLYMAWNNETPVGSGKWEIYFATRPKGGSWTKPENISHNMGVSGHPTLAFDPNGTLHLTWHDNSYGNYDIYHTTRAADGTWAKPVNVSRTKGDSADVSMAIDSKGTVYLAWSDNTPANWDIYYTSLPAK